VADGLPGLLKSEKVKRLRPHARQLAVEGRQLRLTGEETMKLLEEELDKLEASHERCGHIDGGFSKSFGRRAAVWELNLRIQPGAVYGFLGRNGAGKTTTMRMLLGLVRPTKEARGCWGSIPRTRQI